MAMGDNSSGGGDGVNGSNSGGNTGVGNTGGGGGGNGNTTSQAFRNPYANVAGPRLPGFGQFDTFISNYFQPNFDLVRSADNERDMSRALATFNDVNANRSRLGSELQNRQNAITNFNTQVGQFNDSLTSRATPLNQTLDFLRTADLNQFDSDFGGFTLPNRSTLSGLTFDAATPSYNDTFTVGGQAIDLGAAGFSPLSTPIDQQQILGDYDEAIGLRNTFQNDLDTRQASNRAFSTGFDNDLDAISRILDRGDFYGDGDLDAIFSDLGGLEASLGGRQVKLDSFRPTFDTLGGDLNSLRDQFDVSQGLYDDERTRVDNFISGADRDLFGLQNQFSDLGIADFAQFDDFDNQIDELTGRLANFDSEIDTNDPSRLLGFAQDLDRDLFGLRGDYRDELDRIENARRGFRGDVRNISDDIANASIYNGFNLDNIDRSADNLFDDANYFDSELQTDFSGVLGSLSEQEALLQALRDERSTALTGINDNIGASLQSGIDAELYNEDAIQEALRAIQDEQLRLGRFSGGGLDTISNSGDQAVGQLDQRIADLNSRRDLIETNALDMFTDLSDDRNAFGSLDDVSEIQGLLDAIAAERDLFGASQANNEVVDIQDLINQNASRIEGDMELLTQRTNAEQQAQFNNLFNIDRNYVANQFASGNLSPEEYAILLGKVRERDPEFANTIAAQYQNLFG